MALDSALIAKAFGDAASSQFVQMLAVFSLAAKIHGGQVAASVRKAVAEMTAVLREDLEEQRKMTGALTIRVDTIESKLKTKE